MIASVERRAEPKLALSYVLPLRLADDEPVDELAQYLADLAEHVDEVLVVDGSSPRGWAAHRKRFGPGIVLMRPHTQTQNGKVGGVVTGVEAARNEFVVIADDDVRYERSELISVMQLLASHDVVRPQNYFAPLPWHARFDTARTLMNRSWDGDWPGTLGLRRDVLLRAGGYSGDVLFENLELVRTVEAAGGRHTLALDLLVRRIPPTSTHFRGQQVRQAYDELARPLRLVASLAAIPVACVLAVQGHWRTLLTATLGIVTLAELGRRRGGGRRVYPASSILLAPAWFVWRSGCSWAALGAYLRGGVRYRGTRLRTAATPRRHLARAHARREFRADPARQTKSG